MIVTMMRYNRKNSLWILDHAFEPYKQTTCTPANLKTFIDYNYLDKLTEEEQIWLAEFTDAYYTGANNKVSKTWSKEEKRDCYNRNNARIRGVMNKHHWISTKEHCEDQPNTNQAVKVETLTDTANEPYTILIDIDTQDKLDKVNSLKGKKREEYIKALKKEYTNE